MSVNRVICLHCKGQLGVVTERDRLRSVFKVVSPRAKDHKCGVPAMWFPLEYCMKECRFFHDCIESKTERLMK